MNIDPSQNTSIDNYKILTNLVVPRPIAWVTSQNERGVINLAPFSFFNAVGHKPLYIAFSAGKNDDGSLKHSETNILRSREFVVNLVTEDLLQAMNVTAADFPESESELSAAGLSAAPSERISVPRVAEAQASMECRLFSTQPLGGYTLLIGEVVMFHLADHLMGPRFHINGFNPIGRMGSPSFYCRTADRIEMSRFSYAKWKSGEA